VLYPLSHPGLPLALALLPVMVPRVALLLVPGRERPWVLRSSLVHQGHRLAQGRRPRGHHLPHPVGLLVRLALLLLPLALLLLPLALLLLPLALLPVLALPMLLVPHRGLLLALVLLLRLAQSAPLLGPAPLPLPLRLVQLLLWLRPARAHPLSELVRHLCPRRPVLGVGLRVW
jgi:hypothetical protein